MLNWLINGVGEPYKGECQAKPQRLTPVMRGWERAWQDVARTFGDASCPEDGEVWQYMGTQAEGHCFRHRCLDGRRVYHFVRVEEGDFEEG